MRNFNIDPISVLFFTLLSIFILASLLMITVGGYIMFSFLTLS